MSTSTLRFVGGTPRPVRSVLSTIALALQLLLLLLLCTSAARAQRYDYPFGFSGPLIENLEGAELYIIRLEPGTRLVIRNCSFALAALVYNTEFVEASVAVSDSNFTQFQADEAHIVGISFTRCRFVGDGTSSDTQLRLVLGLHERGIDVSVTQSYFERHVRSTDALYLRLTDDNVMNGTQLFGSIVVADNTFVAQDVRYFVHVDVLSWGEPRGSLVNVSGNSFRVSAIRNTNMSNSDADAHGVLLWMNADYLRRSAVAVGKIVVDDNELVITDVADEGKWMALWLAGRVQGVSVLSMSRNRMSTPGTLLTSVYEFFGCLCCVTCAGFFNVGQVQLNGNTRIGGTAFGESVVYVRNGNSSNVGSITATHNTLLTDDNSDMNVVVLSFAHIDVNAIEVSHNRGTAVLSDASPRRDRVTGAAVIRVTTFAEVNTGGGYQAINGTLVVGTIMFHNNSGDVRCVGQVYGVYLSARLRNVKLISIVGNNFRINSTFLHSSSPRDAYAIGVGILRVMWTFTDVETILIERNSGHVVYDVAGTAAAVIVGSELAQSVAAIVIRHNNFSINKREYDGLAERYAGVISVSSVGQARGYGLIEISDNTAIMTATAPCPVSGCIGISMFTTGKFQGIAKLLVERNTIVVRSVEFGAIGFLLYVAGGGEPERDLAAMRLLVPPGNMSGVANVTVANNNVTLSDPDSVTMVAVGVSGALQVGFMRVSDNVFTNERPLLTAVSAALVVSCPRGGLRTSGLTLRLDCASVSDVSIGTLELRNMRVGFGGRALYTASTLRADSIVVRNVTLALDALALAGSSAPAPDSLRAVLVETARWRVAVAALRMLNVTLRVRAPCAPMAAAVGEAPSGRAFSDRVQLARLAQIAPESSVLVDGAVVLVQCTDAAATPAGRRSVAAVALGQPIRALVVSNSRVVVSDAPIASGAAPAGPAGPASLGGAVRCAVVAVAAPAAPDAARSAVNVSRCDVRTTAAPLDALVAMDAAPGTPAAAEWARPGGGVVAVAVTCTDWNGQQVLSYKFAAARNSIGAVSVQPCGHARPSRSESAQVSPSLSPDESLTPSTTRSASRSARPPRPDPGLPAAVLRSLETAASVGTAVAAVVASNPSALLASARGSVLLRLAACRMSGAGGGGGGGGGPDGDALMRNATLAAMVRSLEFPETLVPGFTIGPRVGASHRGAVVANVVALAFVSLLTLYLGVLSKSTWVGMAFAAHDQLRAGAEGVGGGGGGGALSGGADAAQAAADTSAVQFCPLDRLWLKILVLMLPAWSHVAGALAAAQIDGSGDVVLGVLPLAAVGAFVLYCGRYVWCVVSAPAARSDPPVAVVASVRRGRAPRGGRSASQPSSPPPRSAAGSRSASRMTTVGDTDGNGGGDRRDDMRRFVDARGRELRDGQRVRASSSPSPAPSPHPHPHPHPRHPVENAVAPTPAPEPAFYVEPAALFFPLGASLPFQHVLHRAMQHAAARWAMVGDFAWRNPYVVLRTNRVAPGPGPLTQFAYLFGAYWGPTMRPAKKARAGASSASAPRLVYETSLALRLCTCWLFWPILSTLAAAAIGGAGDARPEQCYTAFMASLALTLPSAIGAVALRPYLVPLRNWVLIAMEVCTAVSGVMFASVLLDSEATLEDSRATVAAAQVLATVPGAVLGPFMTAVGVCRMVMLRLGRSRVVTLTALREQLPRELDAAEERLLRPTPARATQSRFGLDTSWLFDGE